jgi:hypothetical protein
MSDTEMLNQGIYKTVNLVWNHLAKNGRCSIIALQKNIGMDIGSDAMLFYQALNYLVHENKISMSDKAKITDSDIWLTDDEMKIYKQRTDSGDTILNYWELHDNKK